MNRAEERVERPHSRATQGRRWSRFLYNHNPFYVLSACFALYGIQSSFRHGTDLADGWLLLQLLGGYTFLLVLSGILIVRVGAVWEDARTIVLLVIVLVVAISASFDKICLDSVLAGRRIQLFGFCLAVGLMETLLRGIRAKLSLAYRFPLYLIFGLLFYFPTWLGKLSIDGNDARMSWGIFWFPYLAATVLLCWLPAAHRAGRGESPNGTPWSWPLYPWCGLAFIAVAVIVRAYGLSVSFELADGLQSAFAGYFLVPIFLAVLWLLTELAVVSHRPEVANRLVWGTTGMLALSFPGHQLNPVQESFLHVVQTHLGSPVHLTCLMCLCYLLYTWLRGVSTSEWWLVGVGLLWGGSRTTTVSLLDLHSPGIIVSLIVSLFLFIRSYQRRCSSRFLLGSATTAFAIIAGTKGLLWLAPIDIMIGVGLVAWSLAGLLFRDHLANIARSSIQYVTLTASVIAIASGFRREVVFPIPELLVASAVPLILALYWSTDPTLRRLIHGLLGIAALALQLSITGYAALFQQTLVLEGQRWIIIGLLSLLVGVALSLEKAGVARMSLHRLARWNRWLAATL